MTTTLILALFCGVPENKWGHISLHLAYLLKAKKKSWEASDLFLQLLQMS